MKCRVFVLVAFLVAAVCCVTGSVFGLGAGTDDFRLQLTPAVRTITAGESTHYQVTVQFTGDFNTPVELSVSGLPAGVTGNFSVNPVTHTGDGRTKLEIDSLPTAPPGTYLLTVTGRGGTLEHTYTVTLIINGGPLPEPDFKIEGNPDAHEINAAESAVYIVSLTALNGFNSAVDLSVSGLPDGAAGSFSVTSVTPAPTGESMLTISTDAGIHAGNYIMTVWARESGGTLEHSIQVELIIKEVTEPVFTGTIQKSFSTSRAFPGDEIAMTLRVKNTAVTAMTGVSLQDELPPALEYLGDDAPVRLRQSGRKLVWMLPGMTAGEVISFTVRLRVSEKARAGMVANTAYLLHDSLDKPVASNTAELFIDTVAVSLSKTVDKALAKPGDKLRYRLVLKNRSSLSLTGIELVDDLPADLDIVTTKDNGAGKFHLTRLGQKLTWKGDLPAGKEQVFTIETGIKETVMAGTQVRNIASLAAALLKENLESNPVVTVIAAQPVPISGVRFDKRCDIPQTQVGRIVRFQLTIVNSSSSALLSPLVEDHLPQGLSYVPGSTRVDNKPAAEPRGSRSLQWSLDLIGPGRTVELHYQVVIAADAKRGKNVNRAILRALDNSGQTIVLEASAFVQVAADSLIFFSAVNGTVFIDRDGDTFYSMSDTPLPGIEIRLSNGDKAITANLGEYEFQQLYPGEYAVGINKATLPEKYRLADTVPRVVVLADGLSDTVDFALKFAGDDDVGTARLQGRVFFDKNGDGAYDSSDALVNEFQVKLVDKLSTRGSNGSFVFTNLEPGSYTIEILYENRTLQKEILLIRGENLVEFPLEYHGIKVEIRGKQ